MCFSRATAPCMQPNLGASAASSLLHHKKTGSFSSIIPPLFYCISPAYLRQLNHWKYSHWFLPGRCQVLRGEVCGRFPHPARMHSCGWGVSALKPASANRDLSCWRGGLWPAPNRKMPMLLLAWFVPLFHYFPSLLWPIINGPTFYLVFLFPLIYL